MQTVEQLCEQLTSLDQVKVYQAKRALVQLAAAAGAPANESRRAELAAALAGQLVAGGDTKDAQGNPAFKHSAEVRGEIARVLSLVAGEAEVPALVAALAEFSGREMARWALARITSQAATDALVEAAIAAVGTEFRLGAIGALGRRAGSNVVEALKKCAADSEGEASDVEIRLAAADALANHADPSLDAVIVEIARDADPRTQSRAAKARIRLAETLVRAGQKEAGRHIYQAIAHGHADEPQQQAARLALAELG